MKPGFCLIDMGNPYCEAGKKAEIYEHYYFSVVTVMLMSLEAKAYLINQINK